MSPSNKKAPTKENLMKEWFAKFFIGKSAAWTAIFTCALVVFSFLLYRSNQQANETSLAVQRAFLTYVPMQPSWSKVPSAEKNEIISGYNFNMALVNNGTTPTKSAIYQVNIAVSNSAPSKGLDFSSLQQSEKTPYVFGPRFAAQVKPVFVSLTDIEAVSQAKKHIFIWGWAVYRDIFDGTPTRLTEFCNEVTEPVWTKPTHTDPSAEMGSLFLPCPTYNCYDENCGDYSERIKLLK